MRILGIDSGFATFGMATLEVRDVVTARYVTTVRTKASAKKARMHSADDTVRRIRELYDSMRRECIVPDIVAVEQFSDPRKGSSAKIGMAYGLVIAYAREIDAPLVLVSPQEAKREVTGKPSASKSEVEAAVKLRYDDEKSRLTIEEFEWKVPASAREHGFDALAVATAALRSDVAVAIRNMREVRQ